MQTVTKESSEGDKIKLFRSLFKGRTDVFPRRFESRRNGKTGYSPACHNEWVRGICEKPRVKCADCPHQAFVEISDRVLRWHLSGKDDRYQPFVMGIYPMLLDETCHFLAVDFDRDSWKEDSSAYLETCHELNLPACLERSRSGNGGHVWFFFKEAVPASLARSMGSALITRTMQRRPEIGLKSYDRLFPNQDTLPKGGFGNLIALPLQWDARQQGNSEFVDLDLNCFPDQWDFLSSLKRIQRSEIESAVKESSAHGGVIGVRLAVSEDDEDKPWALPPSRVRKDQEPIKDLPKSLEIILSDQIYIAKEQLPAPLRNRVIRLAAFQNPEFYKNQAMRLPTYGTPRIITCVEETTKHLGIPRGCLDELFSLFEGLKIKLKLRDERPTSASLSLSFQPGKFFWRQTTRPKYVRRDNRLLPLVIEPAPVELSLGGKATAGLMAHLLVSRFCDHLPYYRQQAMYSRQHGVWISRQLMVQWVKQGVDQLERVVSVMRQELRRQHYLQVDETAVRYQDKNRAGPCPEGWLWVGLDPGRAVVFHWDQSRGSKALEKLIGTDFKGLVGVDGYSAYRAYATRREGIELIGCWAHARRKFFEAKAEAPRIVGWVLNQMGWLFHWESMWQKHAGVERQRLRASHSRMVVERLREVFYRLAPRYRPNSLMREAIDYSINQWSALTAFLEHGEAELSNNWVENAIRPSALGKRNWLFMGHLEAGERSAVVYSLTETCRMLGIDPYAYLRAVLTQLPGTADADVGNLTPANWAILNPPTVHRAA